MHRALPPETTRVLSIVRWPVGGITTHISYTYPTLVDAGYRFTFLGPADDTFRAFAEKIPSWPNTQFVEAPVSGSRCRLKGVARKLLRSKSFSLMHAHGLTAGVSATLANWGIRCPLVITLHDTRHDNEFPGVAGWAKRLALGEILRRATVVVPCSQDCMHNHYQYLPALRRGPCRVVPIDNGIDSLRFAQRPRSVDRLKATLGLNENVHLLGYLGRFMAEKGFLTLLDAMEQLITLRPIKPYHLLAVGSGDYRREYEAKVRSRGNVSPHITFVDSVVDIVPMLHQLDTVVIPSHREAGNVLSMEALCAGVPVVGADCIGLRHNLRDTPSIVVPTDNAEALASGLREAIELPRREAAQAYSAVASKRFDVRQRALEVLEVFRSCKSSKHVDLSQAAITNGRS